MCDIFTQINSRGIRLDVFDLVNALLKPKGLQLKHLWRDAAPRLEFVESERLNVYILQVMSILRQAYCSPKYLYYLLPGQERKVREASGSLRKEVLVPTVQDFERRWRERWTLSSGRSLATPPARVWRHRVAIPAVCLDPTGVRRGARGDAGAAGQPATRWAAQAPSLVLGQRLHEPLFRVGRVNSRA